MTVTQHASGSSTSTTLATDVQFGSDITTPGIYVLEIDVDTYVDGETLILVFKEKVLAGSSTHKEVDRLPASVNAVGPAVLAKFGPYEIVHSGQFFGHQIGGSARTPEWSIRRLDG